MKNRFYLYAFVIFALLFSGPVYAIQITGAPPAAAVGPLGKVIQIVSTQTPVYSQGTALIPFDDTIPQQTEGTQLFTLNITPQHAFNKLVMTVNCPMTTSTGTDYIIGAFFQDAGADAIGASANFNPAANMLEQFTFVNIIQADTTTTTTIKFRYGPHFGGFVTINGVTGTRRFGGVSACSMQIVEYSTTPV